MKRKSCSFLVLFLAFSLFACTNDNSVNSGSLEPSISTSDSTKSSISNSGSISSSGSPTSVSTSTKPSTSTSNSTLPSTSTSSSTSEVPTKDDVSKVIEKAVSKANLIANGKVKISSKDDWTDESSESSFEFGKDANGDTLHYTGKEYSGEYDMYLLTDTDGSIVAIQKSKTDGAITKPYDEFESIGFRFSNVLGYSASFTGVENLVQGLYGYGIQNVNKDFKYQVENEKYSFSFGYFESLDTWQFLKVSCEFTIGEKEEFSSVNVTIDTYSQSSFMVDDELGVIQLNSDAKASGVKNYEISQKLGNRTFVSPISLSSLKVTSFDVMLDDKVVASGDTIKVEKGESINLALSNVIPETASFAFDEPQISVSEGLILGFSSFNNSINGTPDEVGEFDVSIKTTNVTKSFKIEVTEAQPKSITLSYFTVAPKGYNSYVLANSKIDGFVGVEYIIKAGVLPDAADQNVNASIDGVDSSKYELTKKKIKVNEWMDEADMWSFVAKESGDYAVTFASSVNASIKEVVNIHVDDAPAINEMLSSAKFGTKQGANLKYQLEFAPNSTGETGSVIIQDKLSSKEEVASYVISKGEKCYNFALTHVSGDSLEMQLVMSFDFSLSYYNSDWDMYESLYKITPEFLVAGSTFEGKSDTHTFSVSLMNDSQASLSLALLGSFDSLYLNCAFSLKEEGDHYVGTFTSTSSETSFVTLPLPFTLSKDMTTLTVSFEIDGNVETFTCSRSE